jgi:hypothetical protein
MREEAARIVTGAHPRTDDAPTDGVRCFWLILAVALFAALINTAAALATHLWVLPDSSYYISLAGGIAERADFSNEHFLIRPPGYPLFLAGVFKLFGEQSPTAIQVIQHVMNGGVAVLIALTAWELTHRRAAVLIAGFFTVISPQLLAFADVIMPETSYTLCLSAAVYFLTRYHRRGRLSAVALTSMMIGLSYLFRPTGLSMLAGCGIAWLFVVARTLRARADVPRRHTWIRAAAERLNLSAPRPKFSLVRRGAAALGLASLHTLFALFPCALIVAPVVVHNRLTFGKDLTDRCAKLALYYRLLVMDGLDAPDSAALNEIKQTVAAAKWRRALPRHADYRQWGAVLKAYENVKKMALPETAGVIGQAAMDVFREHQDSVLQNTVRYAWWMCLRPDSTYRFLPGGAPGWIDGVGESIRDPNAVIFDIGTYQPMLAGWIEPYEKYLPLRVDTTKVTAPWDVYVRAYHDHVENGPPPVGLGDSLYEELGLICIAGMFITLFTRERGGWLIIMAVIGSQIVPSAFLAGPTPRYAVPLVPLFVLFAANLLAMPFALRRANAEETSSATAAPVRT